MTIHKNTKQHDISLPFLIVLFVVTVIIFGNILSGSKLSTSSRAQNASCLPPYTGDCIVECGKCCGSPGAYTCLNKLFPVTTANGCYCTASSPVVPTIVTSAPIISPTSAVLITDVSIPVQITVDGRKRTEYKTELKNQENKEDYFPFEDGQFYSSPDDPIASHVQFTNAEIIVEPPLPNGVLFIKCDKDNSNLAKYFTNADHSLNQIKSKCVPDFRNTYDPNISVSIIGYIPSTKQEYESVLNSIKEYTKERELLANASAGYTKNEINQLLPKQNITQSLVVRYKKPIIMSKKNKDTCDIYQYDINGKDGLSTIPVRMTKDSCMFYHTGTNFRNDSNNYIYCKENKTDQTLNSLHVYSDFYYKLSDSNPEYDKFFKQDCPNLIEPYACDMRIPVTSKVRENKALYGTCIRSSATKHIYKCDLELPSGRVDKLVLKQKDLGMLSDEDIISKCSKGTVWNW